MATSAPEYSYCTPVERFLTFALPAFFTVQPQVLLPFLAGASCVVYCGNVRVQAWKAVPVCFCFISAITLVSQFDAKESREFWAGSPSCYFAVLAVSNSQILAPFC